MAQVAPVLRTHKAAEVKTSAGVFLSGSQNPPGSEVVGHRAVRVVYGSVPLASASMVYRDILNGLFLQAEVRMGNILQLCVRTFSPHWWLCLERLWGLPEGCVMLAFRITSCLSFLLSSLLPD